MDYAPYGEYTTINVTNIPKDIAGVNITITIDGIPYNVTINKTTGKATLRLNNLSGGSHSAVVSYPVDVNYTNISQKLFPNIPKATPSLTIERGENLDVTVTIDPIVNNQDITVYINGVPYAGKTNSNGVATIEGKLIIGNNYVFAVYAGNENYTNSYNVNTFEVDQITTSLTVEAEPESVYVGQQTTITVTMTGVTAGKVLIEVNNYNYTVDINQNGVATLTVVLPIGDYTPKAYYLGDAQHKPSKNEGDEFHVIDKITPSITITVPSDAKVGDTVTIPVSSDGYDLKVWINNVEQEIVNGNIVYTVGNAGIYTIFAKTTENYQYYAANRTESFEVVRHDRPMVITVVDKDDIKVGDNVAITVTLDGVGAGEKVTIEINGVKQVSTTDANGVASFTVPSITYGDKTVVASYGGNNKYVYNSTTEQFSVGKRDPSKFDVVALVLLLVKWLVLVLI